MSHIDMIDSGNVQVHLQIHEKLFFSLLTVVCVSWIVIFVVVPLEYIPFVVVSLICIGVGVSSIWKPANLLYLIAIASPVAGLLREAGEFGLSATRVTVSGFVWVFISFEGIFVLWLWRKQVRFPRMFFWFALFEAWVISRWCLAPNLSGLKDVLFYGFPLLVVCYAGMVLAKAESRAQNNLRRIILWSPFVPLCYLLIGFPTGIIQYVPGYGPRGPFEPRGMCAYLIVALSLALATWRYGSAPKDRDAARFLSILSIALIVFTLSRSAIVIAFLIFGISRMSRFKLRQGLVWLGFSFAIMFITFAVVPELQSRIYFSGESLFSEGITLNDVNTEGRLVFWAATFAHAVERPIVGWGTGSARELVAQTFPGGEWEEYYPHNEYLEVFHDLGLVGLILMVSAWFSLLIKYWRSWRSSQLCGDLGQAKWDLAAFLALLAVLLDVVTSNDLHYAFVTGPIFLIIALSESNRASLKHAVHRVLRRPTGIGI